MTSSTTRNHQKVTAGEVGSLQNSMGVVSQRCFAVDRRHRRIRRLILIIGGRVDGSGF